MYRFICRQSCRQIIMHIGRQTGRQYRVLAVLSGSSKDMYNHDVGKRFYEVKRHSDERHPLFYFISFIGIYSPLTDIVIIHIVYINETNPEVEGWADGV